MTIAVDTKWILFRVIILCSFASTTQLFKIYLSENEMDLE